ncbi:MAG: type II toxin-antitoxin system VapC family toxin [Cellulomonadaceae bacterium]
MIVVDASVVVVALVDGGHDGIIARGRMRAGRLCAPELLWLEVASVLRRQVTAGHIEPSQAADALDDLLRLPVLSAPHPPLVRRIWELRENITPYDAAYVALAESLGTTLVTADARLSRAPGPRCDIELLAS